MNRPQRAHSKTADSPPRDAGSPADLERRILILAPTGNDARLTADFLGNAGMGTRVCRDLAQLGGEVTRGCGAILLAEETLGSHSISLLVDALAQQLTWSDIPVVIITSGGEANQTQLRRLAIFGPSGNVNLLERPFRPGTLVSTLEVALRARKRQYEARNLMHAMGELMREREAQRRLFDATLSSITDLAYTFDLEGNWIYANKPLLELWGKTLEEITGKSSLALGYPEELAARLKHQVKEVVATRQPVRGETYFTDAAGIEDYHEYIFCPVFDLDGSVTAVCGTTRLATARKRAEAAAENQRRVLQLVAEDRPLTEVLAALTRAVELECTTETYASVLLLDSDELHLRYGAAPSLAPDYVTATDGLAIGPAAGSCGTAAFLKKPVFVSDIATDPLGKDFKVQALNHGLRSCWSLPILSTTGGVLGVFAIYHPDVRVANEKDVRTVETATRTAAIAIERKLSDTAVRESQDRYRQLIQGLPTAIYTTDAEGRVTLFNEAAATLWGREPTIGLEIWSGPYRMFRPDGSVLPADQCPMARTLREGRSIRGEEIIIERPNGMRRHVLPYPDPIRNGAGKVVGTVNLLLDVTEIKRAEENSRRLAAIVESSDDAIISKNLEGVITSWNRGAVRLFGYEADEVVGGPVTILIPAGHDDEEVNILQRIRRGERMEQYETVRRRKDGSPVEISLTVSPIRDASGRIIGASKIARDITEKKQAERQLAQAHEEALAASRAKDEFLAALSHELRTPLNPVLLLASEGAADPGLPPEIRAQFTSIRNNVELEARLIDDLLDITGIAHGKFSMNVGLIDLDAVLKEAIGTIKPEADQKRIAVTKEFGSGQRVVEGDGVRLQQVFWNVLKNAVKFTPAQGSITVQTRTDPAGQVVVAITDSGIGMTPDELSRVFEAFAQGEHVRSGGSHRFGGLGLGLAISRKLVESHHGTIEARSAGRNQGSTFVITLPLSQRIPAKPSSKGENGAASTAIKKNARPIQVLLVEDHEPTRAALASLLKRRHYEVKTAASVAEARAWAGKQKFQLLVSDIGLPDGSGFELIRELRAANASLQGIALTGYGMEEDILRSEKACFASHLTKPIRVQSLEAALASALPPAGAKTAN